MPKWFVIDDDGTIALRVDSGPPMQVQLEPAVMRLSGYEIAQLVMACADTAYLDGQAELQQAWEEIL